MATRRSKNKRQHDRERARAAAKTDAAAQRGGAGLLSVPSGLGVYKPKEDTRDDFAIVPFTVTKALPCFRKYEVGDLCYSLQYGQHRDVGPGDDKIICPKATLGKPCPICEEFESLRDDEEYDDIKHMRPSKRDAFIVATDKDTAKLLDMPTWFFGKALAAEMSHAIAQDEALFYLPEDDTDVRVSWVEGNFKGTVEASSITFIPRRKPLDEAMLEEWEQFDMLELIDGKVLTYEQIQAVMNGDEVEAGEEQEETKLTPRQQKAKDKLLAKGEPEPEPDEEPEPEPEEPEGDDNEEDCNGLFASIKETGDRAGIRKAKKLLTALDIDGLEDLLEELTEEPEEEEEEPPAKETAAQKKKRLAREKKAAKEEDADNPCPYGYTYGADCDKNPDDCDNCDLWNDCLEAK